MSTPTPTSAPADALGPATDPTSWIASVPHSMTAPDADATAATEREARAALDALPGLAWRPFGRADLPALAAFYAEVETFDDNPERTSVADLEDFWDSPRSVPAEDTLAAWDTEGRVVATAWSGCNRSVSERRTVFLGGAVLPKLRGRGLGRRILTWELAHGLAWDAASREPGFGPLVFRLYAPVDQADVRDLAERAGVRVVRHFFEMERPLDDRPCALRIPGIRYVGWDPQRSDEVLAVVNASFRDHWGHVDASPQMWADQVGAQAFRPQWTVLALDEATDRVVGVAMNCAYEQDWTPSHREGYTDQLGVLREYRGRGIARGLLLESMARFAAAGLDAAALGVDVENPSGALGLYERLGYRATASTCVHERQEQPDDASLQHGSEAEVGVRLGSRP